MELSNTR